MYSKSVLFGMASGTPDTIAPNALDWSKAHISRFGDTDFFPLPFEFECLWGDWSTVKAALSQLDLANLPPRPHRTMLVPKPRGGFRVVTQLDPLDAVLYAAIGFEAAPVIEQWRTPASQKIACSYRLAPDASGALFSSSADGWTDFQSHSTALASKTTCTYVALADISDFYNQIYHHRMHNALESASIPSPRPTSIEAFVGRITAKQSRGLPVGPSASIILAEACLDDVDQRLRNVGLVHTRYVDDFRVFCKSEAEAHQALHELTRYLFTAHRLSLQAHKTRVVNKDDFVRRDLVEPEEREKRSKLAEAKKLIQEAVDAAGHYGGDIDEKELLEEHDNVLARRALVRAFKATCKKSPLDLGLSRYLLRRAAKLRTRELVLPVTEHLHVLAPVFRDVAIYYDRVWHDTVQDIVRTAIPNFLKSDSLGWLPYVQEWSLWLMHKRQFVSKVKEEAVLARVDESIRFRHYALLAKRERRVEWIRQHKETWMNLGPWDRRAVLWAASALPRDERRAWLEPITQSQDLVEAAIAKHIRSEN